MKISVTRLWQSAGVMGGCANLSSLVELRGETELPVSRYLIRGPRGRAEMLFERSGFDINEKPSESELKYIGKERENEL